MHSLRRYLCSSIGKKQMMALTGLGLSVFVLIHMSGNLFLLVGQETYNQYSHKLTSNPLIYFAEVGLALTFLVHIALGIRLAAANRSSRAVGPYKQPDAPAKSANVASRSMIWTGLLVLVFLVLHLWTFKYGAYYPVTYNGVEMRDLYRLVFEKFQSPLYTGWYLFSMLILGLHLSHGFAATFQTLGFSSVHNRRLKKVGWAFAAMIALGFFSQPIFLFVVGGKA
jgi:succinate dehydrogenase / fumarate reductase cytochrome b subunit